MNISVEHPFARAAAAQLVWREVADGVLHRLALLLVVLFPTMSVAAGESASADKPAPFLRLRDFKLGYSGPANQQSSRGLAIGWFGPTNTSDPLNGDTWWAINWAMEEANRSAGSNNLPVCIVPCWAPDPWGSGVSKLTRIVYQEQPVALLGSVDSASTHLAEQVVAKANLPLVSPISTDKSATLAGVPWMFSCAPTDVAVARSLVPEILAALQASGSDSKPGLLMLAYTDHDSRMTARELHKELSRRGRLPDHRLDIPAQELRPDRHLSRLTSSGTSVVLIVAGPEDAARLVVDVRRLFPSAQVFGSHGMSRHRFAQLAGAAGEGVRFPLLVSSAATQHERTPFEIAFSEAHRREPDYASVLAYDAIRMLLDAIQQAGADRASIRQALQALSPWKGTGGAIAFDGTGQNTRADLRIGTLRAGSVVPLLHSAAETAELTHSP